MGPFPVSLLHVRVISLLQGEDGVLIDFIFC